MKSLIGFACNEFVVQATVQFHDCGEYKLALGLLLLRKQKSLHNCMAAVYMVYLTRKLSFSECENRRLHFPYTDSTLSVILKSEISGFQPSSMTYSPVCVRPGLQALRLVFSQLMWLISRSTENGEQKTSAGKS